MPTIGVVDIETTGFLNKGGKIVEIGIAKFDTDNLDKVEAHYHTICKEDGLCGRDRKSWIFQNSDLTVDEVRNAPLLSTISHEVQAALDELDYKTAYNKRFDFDFLESREIGIGQQLACPMLELTPVLKLPKRGYSARHAGYKWPKVEEAWEYFFPETPYEEQHRGLDDAVHEARIVIEAHKRGYFHLPRS